MGRPTRNYAPLPLAVLASEASPRARLLILALCHHDWDNGAKAWPGQRRLAVLMGTNSLDTVQRAIMECEALGWLRVERRSGDGANNIYHLDIPRMECQEFEAWVAAKSGHIESGRSRKKRLQEDGQVAAKSGLGSRKKRLAVAAKSGPNYKSLRSELKDPNQDAPDGAGADEAAKPPRAQPQPRTQKPEPSEAFAAYWRDYPRHDARADALKAWAQVDGDHHIDAIRAALLWQRGTEQWRKSGGQFVPLPATYLRGRRWEDEQPQAGTAGASAPAPKPRETREQAYQRERALENARKAGLRCELDTHEAAATTEGLCTICAGDALRGTGYQLDHLIAAARGQDDAHA